MIYNQAENNNEDYEVIGEDIVDGIELLDTGIDDESLPFVFDVVTKGLYSNRIGSIVREISSNCVDAIKEAKDIVSMSIEEIRTYYNKAYKYDTDEEIQQLKDYLIERNWKEMPIRIYTEFNPEDNLEYVVFEDNGIGLSKNRILKVYRKYFSSTKRETNNQIGKFGLGSKTPFVITDYFFCETCYLGEWTNYVVQKGQKKPKIVKIESEKRDCLNFTRIKVPFSHESSIREIRTSINYQLVYFDNIYTEIEGTILGENHLILKGENFITHKAHQSTVDIYYNGVVYPIDFGMLEIDTIYLPISVYITGDVVDITPSRESLIYDSEHTKRYLLYRIFKACTEFLNKFELKTGLYGRHLDFYWISKKSGIALEGTQGSVSYSGFSGIDKINQKTFYDDSIPIKTLAKIVTRVIWHRHSRSVNTVDKFKEKNVIDDNRSNNAYVYGNYTYKTAKRKIPHTYTFTQLEQNAAFKPDALLEHENNFLNISVTSLQAFLEYSKSQGSSSIYFFTEKGFKEFRKLNVNSLHLGNYKKVLNDFKEYKKNIKRLRESIPVISYKEDVKDFHKSKLYKEFKQSIVQYKDENDLLSFPAIYYDGYNWYKTSVKIRNTDTYKSFFLYGTKKEKEIIEFLRSYLEYSIYKSKRFQSEKRLSFTKLLIVSQKTKAEIEEKKHTFKKNIFIDVMKFIGENTEFKNAVTLYKHRSTINAFNEGNGFPLDGILKKELIECVDYCYNLFKVGILAPQKMLKQAFEFGISHNHINSELERNLLELNKIKERFPLFFYLYNVPETKNIFVADLLIQIGVEVEKKWYIPVYLRIQMFLNSYIKECESMKRVRRLYDFTAPHFIRDFRYSEGELCPFKIAVRIITEEKTTFINNLDIL